MDLEKKSFQFLKLHRVSYYNYLLGNQRNAYISIPFFYKKMAFRTIYIEKALRVRLDLNNIVVNYEDDNYTINLDEINTIIFDDPRCRVSLRLLATLCELGINVIFNDSSHMPIGSLQTLYNHARAPKKIKNQIIWDKNSQIYLWTELVKHKIKNQILTLKKVEKTEKLELLNTMIDEMILGDLTNKEGIASRVYFKELFGSTFKRFDENIINYALNYIYQIIRSKIAQEIVSCGYIPALGICHKSEFNLYNLADDFIEPFRPICDYFVYEILTNTIEDYLTSFVKRDIVNILNQLVLFKNATYKIHIVIQFYVQSLFKYLETGDISFIQYPTLCNI